MNISLKKLSFAFLFTTSCLTQTAQSMMIDEKESAKECHKLNRRFFIQEFNEALKGVKQNYLEATKDIDDSSFNAMRKGNTKQCTVLAKTKGEEHSKAQLQYYKDEKILEYLEDYSTRDIFLKSYFSHSNMNDVKWTKSSGRWKSSYYFCDSSSASKTVKRENYGFNTYLSEKESERYGMTGGAGWYRDGGSFATSLQDGLYNGEYNKALNGGKNSYFLFGLLDSAIKRIGQKYSKLKMKVREIGITPDKKDWEAITYLNEHELEVTQPLFEACRKAMEFIDFDSRGSIYEEHLPEFITIFRDCKRTVGQYPDRHHIETFQRLMWSKIPLSIENIETVMNMTISIDSEEGSMEERLKRFNRSVNENYTTSSEKAAEWFQDNYKTTPKTQDLLVVRHMMKQEGLKLTPSSFEAAKVLMNGEEKIIPWPTKVQIEIAECWMANSKSPSKDFISHYKAFLSST